MIEKNRNRGHTLSLSVYETILCSLTDPWDRIPIFAPLHLPKQLEDRLEVE